MSITIDFDGNWSEFVTAAPSGTSILGVVSHDDQIGALIKFDSVGSYRMFRTETDSISLPQGEISKLLSSSQGVKKLHCAREVHDGLRPRRSARKSRELWVDIPGHVKGLVKEEMAPAREYLNRVVAELVGKRDAFRPEDVAMEPGLGADTATYINDVVMAFLRRNDCQEGAFDQKGFYHALAAIKSYRGRLINSLCVNLDNLVLDEQGAESERLRLFMGGERWWFDLKVSGRTNVRGMLSNESLPLLLKLQRRHDKEVFDRVLLVRTREDLASGGYLILYMLALEFNHTEQFKVSLK